MAQPRVYRDGMQCPRCGSNWLPKHGRSRGKQTYRCGQCLYHFIPETEHPHQPERVKNMAVAMYAEGNSIEAISRVLEIKAGAVYSWVKKSHTGPQSAADRRRTAPGPQPGTGVAQGHILR